MSISATLHILNDDEVACSVLVRLLAPSGLASVVHGSMEIFLARYNANTPACLLVDMLLPGWGPGRVLRELKRRGILHPAIFMTHRVEENSLTELLRLGAFAFIRKPLNQIHLLELIQEALVEDRRRFPLLFQARQMRDRMTRLSPRERKVLELTLQGLPAREIASRLGSQPRTVENQRLAAQNKLEISGLAATVRLLTLVEVASQLGWLGDGE
ncbi:MAG: response regulator [Magnetococcus sp. WYHC-3]